MLFGAFLESVFYFSVILVLDFFCFFGCFYFFWFFWFFGVFGLVFLGFHFFWFSLEVSHAMTATAMVGVRASLKNN